MSRISRIALLGLAATLGVFTLTSTDASAANFMVNGVWYSNVCRAPSGNWWAFPMSSAEPVGFQCFLPNGEYGTAGG